MTCQARFLTAFVVALLASSSFAQSDAPDSDVPAQLEIAAPKTDKPVTKEELKKLAKYDIEQIGRRGIGRGFNIYSERRERELGQNLASSFDRSTRLITDPVVNEYISRLGQRIARFSDAEIPFTVRIIDAGDIPRAYGLPGGFLYVDSALVLAADDEAELAAVMAHEIAHVAARHATRALTRRNLYRIAGSVALFAGPAGFAVNNASGIAGPLSSKKFSREAEYEADLLGIQYTYAAGYDPQALLTALEKLHAAEANRISAFSKIPGARAGSKLPFHSQFSKSLANYPGMEERIQRLQSEISSFLPARNDYILDTNEFQDIKARLLSFDTLRLRRHHAGEDDPKGPVLRRAPQDDPGDEPQEGAVRSWRTAATLR